MTSIVVIGVGNPYRRDDGAGPAVLAGLRGRDLPGVRLVESDGEAAGLIESWAGADLAVVVDAARTRSPRPGHVHRRVLSREGLGRAGGSASSHAVDLGEVVALARALGRLPGAIELVTVEAEDTGFGQGLSGPVSAAVAGLVDELGERWAGPTAP